MISIVDKGSMLNIKYIYPTEIQSTIDKIKQDIAHRNSELAAQLARENLSPEQAAERFGSDSQREALLKGLESILTHAIPLKCVVKRLI